jgi:MFS family permease
MSESAPPAQLRLLAAYAVFTYPFACVPLLYFHFRAHAIDVTEYALMISVYYVTMVVAEIPTGLLADRYGRKAAMVLGPFLLAAGFWVMWAHDDFVAFCMGQGVLGIGHAVLSGPPSALLYDQLLATGREAEFLAHESRLQATRLLGTAGAFLLGGSVAEVWGIPPTILLSVALCAIAGIAATRLRDVPRAAGPRPRILASAGHDLRSPAVLWILAYFVLVFCLLRYCFHTYQPFLEAADERSLLFIGALFCSMNLLAAACSRLVPRLARSFGERTLFWSVPLLLSLSLVALAGLVQRAGVLLFFLQQVPFGLHWSLIQSFVNHRIRGVSRATVLSVMSFLGRLSFAAIFPLAGALHERQGIGAAYLAVGLAGLVSTVVCLQVGRKLLRK